MTASTSQDLPQIQHQCRAASGRDRLGGLATAGIYEHVDKQFVS